MPKKKKKKKKEKEVLTQLKKKIFHLKDSTSWTTNTGQVTVYRSPAPPQRVIYARDNELVGKEISLLAKKLEQVKNLITDNEIEKLKRMIRRGEI